MKLLQVLSLCASACFFAACSSDDAVEQETKPAAFRVESSISKIHILRSPALDEQGAGQFQTGDVNTLFFAREDGQFVSSFAYTYGTSYFWSDLKLPADLQRCRISACYPQVSTDTPENYSWDVMTAQPTADLLVASPVTAEVNAQQVRLTFAHLMHKLKVVLVSGASTVSQDVLDAASISFRQVLPVAKVNLLQGQVLSASGQPVAFEAHGAQAAFIVPAQPAGKMEVLVKVNGQTAVFPLAEMTTQQGGLLQRLESGKTFTVTIKVTEKDFVVISQDISGWEDQGSSDNQIII